MSFKPRNTGGSFEKDPNIIRLKDGQSVVGVIRGEPVEFFKAFNPGDKPGFRFKVNFIVKLDGTYKAQVLEQGGKVHDAIAALVTEGWDLSTRFIKVSRTGTDKNSTKYSVVISPKEIPAEELSVINKVTLLPLYVPAEQKLVAIDPGAFNNRF